MDEKYVIIHTYLTRRRCLLGCGDDNDGSVEIHSRLWYFMMSVSGSQEKVSAILSAAFPVSLRRPNEEFARNEICKLSNKVITPPPPRGRSPRSGGRGDHLEFTTRHGMPAPSPRPWEPAILNPLNPARARRGVRGLKSALLYLPLHES